MKSETTKHAWRFLLIGTIVTVFNYALYIILAELIIKNTDLLWVSNLIATFLAVILSYILHSKITWKERPTNKTAVYKFFIWNAFITFPVNPGLTQFFSIFTPLYELIYNICQNLHIDFSFEFIRDTGAFILATIVIMIINFLFYDKLVFRKEQK